MAAHLAGAASQELLKGLQKVGGMPAPLSQCCQMQLAQSQKSLSGMSGLKRHVPARLGEGRLTNLHPVAVEIWRFHADHPAEDPQGVVQVSSIYLVSR